MCLVVQEPGFYRRGSAPGRPPPFFFFFLTTLLVPHSTHPRMHKPRDEHKEWAVRALTLTRAVALAAQDDPPSPAARLGPIHGMSRAVHSKLLRICSRPAVSTAKAATTI